MNEGLARRRAALAPTDKTKREDAILTRARRTTSIRVAAFVAGALAVSVLPATAFAQVPAPIPSVDPSASPLPSAEPSVLPSTVPVPSISPTPQGWQHDHSTKAIPKRPTGLYGLKNLFGRHCGRKANDARTYYPSAGGRGKGGYLYYHQRLARNIGHNVVGHMRKANRFKAADYGVWGYACRAKTGGTSWSVHSWGVAIDTNTLRNPWTQTWWNGKGSNGRSYKRYLPKVWINHNFYWGLWFSSTKDPMHFQYVSGY